MARHDMVHYITVGKLKEILNDPHLTEGMLIFAGKVTGDLVVCQAGETKEQECTCWDCQIGDIDLAEETLEMRGCNRGRPQINPERQGTKEV
jgi:hypothetical protein